MTRRTLLAIVLAAYLLFVGWVTLNPAPPDPAGNPWLIRLLDVLPLGYDTVEFLANVGMFVPIGALVVALSGRWWLGLAVGLVLTSGIETAQQFLPARFPDVRDLIANTGGAAVGALAVSAKSRRALEHRSRRDEAEPDEGDASSQHARDDDEAERREQ